MNKNIHELTYKDMRNNKKVDIVETLDKHLIKHGNIHSYALKLIGFTQFSMFTYCDNGEVLFLDCFYIMEKVSIPDLQEEFGYLIEKRKRLLTIDKLIA